MKLIIKITDVKKGDSIDNVDIMNKVIGALECSVRPELSDVLVNEQERMATIDLTEELNEHIIHLLEDALDARGLWWKTVFER
ncbi:MAG: hypothetical protein ACRC0G_01590 [Fusobacteriaceae bacterium]